VVRALAVVAGALCASGLVAGRALAQVPTGSPAADVPAIVVTGRADTKVIPDRATVSLGAETRRATAAQAAQENARIQRAILDTLKTMGIGAEEITTADYAVMPDQQYDNTTRQTRITGYIVRNTVRVRVQKLERVGAVIDAALAKGANGVNGLELTASNTDDARRQALAEAVERARKDADAMARAAGGQIVSLLEIALQDGETPVFRPAMAAMSLKSAGGATPIEAGAQTLTVQVLTRWRFAPTPR
jgi:uncharacterized protein YggE